MGAYAEKEKGPDLKKGRPFLAKKRLLSGRKNVRVVPGTRGVKIRRSTWPETHLEKKRLLAEKDPNCCQRK